MIPKMKSLKDKIQEAAKAKELAAIAEEEVEKTVEKLEKKKVVKK